MATAIKVKVKESFGESSAFNKQFVGAQGTLADPEQDQKGAIGKSGDTKAVNFPSGSRLYIEPKHLEEVQSAT